MMSVKREAVNINFKMIGLTRLGIKPMSTAPKADSLTTQPSELLFVINPFFNEKVFFNPFDE